jgi:siroheme synthase (precorrin-2 oxidase/ferrochelatase)
VDLRAGLDKNWTKMAQHLIKFKQKWKRAVKKSDERDEKRESDEDE